MPVRTAIIEDDAVTRQLLRIILESDPRIEFIDAYADAESALEAQSHGLQTTHVFLIDVELPGLSGTACVEKMMHWALPPHVVMLTSSEDEGTILKCIEAGASGYLLKPVNPHLVVSAVLDAASGGTPLSTEVTKTMMKMLRDGHQPQEAVKIIKELPELSNQENCVLRHLAMGDTHSEIASKLHLSEATVRTYIQRVYRKLGVHSRSQAVAKILGITQTES